MCCVSVVLYTVFIVCMMQCSFSQAETNCEKPSMIFFLTSCTVEKAAKPLWKDCCMNEMGMMMKGWHCGYCDEFHLYKCGFCVPVLDGYQVCGTLHSDRQAYCRIGQCPEMGTAGHPIRHCIGDDTTTKAKMPTMTTTNINKISTKSHATTVTSSTTRPTFSVQSTTQNTDNSAVTETTSTSVVNDSINIGVIIAFTIGGIILLAVVVCFIILIYYYRNCFMKWLCKRESPDEQNVRYTSGRSQS